jgi:hypothetical protein
MGCGSETDLCWRVAARGLAAAIVLGGGYARDIEDTADIHLNTLRQALAS